MRPPHAKGFTLLQANLCPGLITSHAAWKTATVSAGELKCGYMATLIAEVSQAAVEAGGEAIVIPPSALTAGIIAETAPPEMASQTTAPANTMAPTTTSTTTTTTPAQGSGFTTISATIGVSMGLNENVMASDLGADAAFTAALSKAIYSGLSLSQADAQLMNWGDVAVDSITFGTGRRARRGLISTDDQESSERGRAEDTPIKHEQLHNIVGNLPRSLATADRKVLVGFSVTVPETVSATTLSNIEARVSSSSASSSSFLAGFRTQFINEVSWDGNGPIRIFPSGFKAVTDQLQISYRPVTDRIHACVFTRCTAAM